jgi:hypothetical protein
MRTFIGLVLLAAIFGPASFAHAHVVSFDPGAYTGSFVVAGASRHGPVAVDLAPGVHYIGWGGVAYVVVEPDGSVSLPAACAERASASGSTVTLHSAVIALDAGAYQGQWNADGTWRRFSASVRVPIGINFIGMGSTVASSATAADATLTVESYPKRIAGGASLRILTVDVPIDVGAYTELWNFEWDELMESS